MKIEKNKNLFEFNFYKLEIRAKYFVELKNKKDFLEFFVWVKKNKIKKKIILGSGSNIIFKTSFYDGVVIKISNNFLKWEKNERKTSHSHKVFRSQKVEVGAGKNLDNFLAECQKKNFFKIQSLASIPGSVGAGVFGNVGAFGQEIKNFISGVWIFDIKKEEFVFLENSQCEFTYRNSIFKMEKDWIIFSIIFDFSSQFQKEVKNLYSSAEYFSLKHFVKKYNLGKIKNNEVRKSIKKLRRKMFPNVKKNPNVGSTFKNTEITKNEFKKLLKNYSNIPNWEQKNGKIKIPTAYIFDKILNINGKTFGNIKIQKDKPLFFVNTGKATGKEFFELCQEIKKITLTKIKIKIEEEIFFID